MLTLERKIQIERLARELQHDMWDRRAKLLPDYHPEHIHPLALFTPELAAKHLGLSYDLYPTLGIFGDKDGRCETAGFLNREKKQMGVSQAFNINIQRFTGAHEIGHYQLHQHEHAFRERPFSGLSEKIIKKPEEQEADHFAACFLMPRNLVKKRFIDIFGTRIPITVDDTLAWHLAGDDFYDLLYAPIDSLIKEKAVARCDHLGAQYFTSLAEQFSVSVESMAIRLKELQLVNP